VRGNSRRVKLWILVTGRVGLRRMELLDLIEIMLDFRWIDLVFKRPFHVEPQRILEKLLRCLAFSQIKVRPPRKIPVIR